MRIQKWIKKYGKIKQLHTGCFSRIRNNLEVLEQGAYLNKSILADLLLDKSKKQSWPV